MSLKVRHTNVPKVRHTNVPKVRHTNVPKVRHTNVPNMNSFIEYMYTCVYIRRYTHFLYGNHFLDCKFLKTCVHNFLQIILVDFITNKPIYVHACLSLCMSRRTGITWPASSPTNLCMNLFSTGARHVCMHEHINLDSQIILGGFDLAQIRVLYYVCAVYSVHACMHTCLQCLSVCVYAWWRTYRRSNPLITSHHIHITFTSHRITSHHITGMSPLLRWCLEGICAYICT
jgi:hypothetical protein